MSEKKTTVSRREFLKDAGLVVGGATIGSAAILSACSGKTTTVTETTTKNSTVTETKTVTGASKFICPVDSKEFSSLADLQSHYTTAHVDKTLENVVTLTVNGNNYTLAVEPWWPLVYVLRDVLGLYSVKVGCDLGNCGTCTILVDGNPKFACLMLACECQGHEIVTMEALSNGAVLSPVEQAFYDHDAYQCGYCTPGLVMAAEALIKKNPKPTAADVQYAFSGHLCFCANMTKQVECLVGGVD